MRCRVDKCFEQSTHGRVGLQPFWVPLYCQEERVSRQLNRFDDTIGSPGTWMQAGGELANSLVMQAVDLLGGAAHDCG